ncbi:PLP-dependent aminotransferase family protein [Bacillus sp. SCS-151]|uniref:MocR-like pyridoxine biosynthesis transcription factor PdxR n=1 Tax=Nanhaiella sioensis TaxID=3115293 RepID=UPI00397C0541
MLEVTLSLDKDSETPLYMQVYQYFIKEIETGKIPPQAKLPSIRSLADHLSVGRNTIEYAYQQLITEGYVRSEPRKRLIVNQLDKDLLSQIHTIPTKKDTADVQQEKHFTYDFRYGNVDLEHIPYKLWKRHMNEVLATNDDQLIFYGDKKGDIQLRQQLVHYLYQARGISCTTDEIIIGAGMYQMLSVISQILMKTNDTVAVENPCYDGAQRVFANHGFNLEAISLEEDGLNIDQLAKGSAKTVYVTPSHQFPMGMVLPIQKRLRLIQWAIQNNGFIIEDDYDSEFRYQGNPIPALKALDRDERVIYIGTFSKSFMPAIRVNYMVLPTRLLHTYHSHFVTYSQPAAALIQKTLAHFLAKGHFERHIRKMRKVYAQKHRVLIEAIHNYMGNKVNVQGTHAGVHVIISIPHRNETELHEKAISAGVNIYSAKKYWVGESTADTAHFILGFGGMSSEKIDEGIKHLSKVWFAD